VLALGGLKLMANASYDESHGFRPYPTADYQPSGTDRHQVMQRMREQGIQTSMHYPPIHRFEVAEVGPAEVPTVVLHGHLDVVPAHAGTTLR
jgi:acetylornithine deacetylase/succinyl-diaminopimelate desuccinylase-like protein